MMRAPPTTAAHWATMPTPVKARDPELADTTGSGALEVSEFDDPAPVASPAVVDDPGSLAVVDDPGAAVVVGSVAVMVPVYAVVDVELPAPGSVVGVVAASVVLGVVDRMVGGVVDGMVGGAVGGVVEVVSVDPVAITGETAEALGARVTMPLASLLFG